MKRGVTSAAYGYRLRVTSYSSTAARWLLGAGAHPGGADVTRVAARLGGVRAGLAVLDVACGGGASGLLLHEELGADVLGVDLELRAVRAARRRGLQVVRGDALELPVRDGAFDVVLCECAASTFPAPGRAIAEMARALAPGGRLILTDVVAALDLRRSHPSVDAAVRRLTGPLPAAGYADLVARARLELIHQESRAADARALVTRVRDRLRLLALSPAVRRLRGTLDEAGAAINEGSLGYTLLIARKPTGPAR